MIKEKIIKLLEVKSLVTLMLTFVFIYLCIAETPIPETLKLIYTSVISFYFGTQATKEKTNKY